MTENAPHEPTTSPNSDVDKESESFLAGLFTAKEDRALICITLDALWLRLRQCQITTSDLFDTDDFTFQFLNEECVTDPTNVHLRQQLDTYCYERDKCQSQRLCTMKIFALFIANTRDMFKLDRTEYIPIKSSSVSIYFYHVLYLFLLFLYVDSKRHQGQYYIGPPKMCD